MAHERDYENMHDIDELDDRELRDLVQEQLSAHSGLDVDDITITTSNNRVTLSGRVGTEGEKRIADHVLTDVLGIVDFSNDLVVDQIRRAESPVDIDEHLADEERRSGTLLGDVAHEDLAGTTDYEQAMGDGMTWNPPESPTPEGFSGTDAGPEDMGE